jgi:hypothetical protein
MAPVRPPPTPPVQPPVTGASNLLADASKQNTSTPSVLDETQAGASSTPASTDEPTKVVLTPTELYAYTRPFLAKGVSYTALATSLGGTMVMLPCFCWSE